MSESTSDPIVRVHARIRGMEFHIEGYTPAHAAAGHGYSEMLLSEFNEYLDHCGKHELWRSFAVELEAEQAKREKR